MPVVPVTVTVVVTVTGANTGTSETSPLATATPTLTPTPTAGPPVVELLDTEVLTGTILANRTEVTATFFLDGQLYELPPLRSTSAVLQRPLTVMTLYNCEIDAQTDSTAATDEACFWDPYPVRQDGFFEIVNGAESGAALSLILQEAAPPPDNQIWIQNRTGHPERFLYADNLYELENSHVLELVLDEPTAEEEVAIGDLYLRRCLGIDNRAVCEWLPQPVVGGIYYALVDETNPGVLPNSAVTTIVLELVLGEERLAALVTPTPEPTPTPVAEEEAPAQEEVVVSAPGGSIICQTQVPRLNVRAGPGVEYVVLTQIEQESDEGRFAAIGRNSVGDWLAVAESVAAGGWVINTPQFVVCDAATDSLAVTPVTDGRLADPTPVPVAAAAGDAATGDQASDQTAEENVDTEVPAEEETADGNIPPGRALLIATNAFDQDIRFTISVREHGLPDDAPSEYDLKPGESVSFLIRAGRVQFSVSSAFRSSSGNAEFFLDEGATRELFLRFFPMSGDPNQWDLQWE